MGGHGALQDRRDPIYDGRRDNLVGFVSLKEIYGRLSAGQPVEFGEIMQAPVLVPEMQKASVLLETFRTSGRLSCSTSSAVSWAWSRIDLMDTIVDDVPFIEEQAAMPIQQRTVGSWLIDGLFEIEKLSEHLEGFQLPEGGGDEYQTVSGWLVKELGRRPAERDAITADEWNFEVIDMEGIRVDKLLATRKPGATVIPR